MQQHTEELSARTLPGAAVAVLEFAVVAGSAALFAIAGVATANSGRAGSAQVVAFVLAGLLLLKGIFLPLGFFVVQPNHAKVVVLFGRYRGTVRATGWHWTNPLTVGQRRLVSLRIRNFDSERLKVNDASGNPVEIAAVIVWRVVDTARAIFDVNDYEAFVKTQSETAIRHLATQYPYDSHDQAGMSLSGNIDEVSATLQQELEERLASAGVSIVETRLSHLSYAPEIASVMLRRQQASAIVAARQKMVEGAVGMVDMALKMIERDGIIELDDERKAAMISNLLVVLTGDQAVHPIVNTGTLHQ
ncbi:MAG: SPFH domain-containing protein [Actinomycetota bacterium]